MELKGINNLSLANPVYAQDIAQIVRENSDFQNLDSEISAPDSQIDSQTAQNRLHNAFEVLDIRDISDFEYAHIAGSKHFSNAPDVFNFAKKNADKKILLVCYSGHTAAMLGTSLVEAGCENIYYFDDYFAHFEMLGLLGE